jgi:hypothetical protein
VGLVGSYEQGLEYIEQQQRVQQPDGVNISDSKATSLLLHDLSMADLSIKDEDDLDNQADDLYCSAECAEAPSAQPTAPAPAADMQTRHLLAPAGPAEDDNVEQWCNDAAEKPAAAAAAAAAVPAAVMLSPGHKVLLWLGSSLGNFTREAGAAFLKTVRELALRPGATLCAPRVLLLLLLLGLDTVRSGGVVDIAAHSPMALRPSLVHSSASLSVYKNAIRSHW